MDAWEMEQLELAMQTQLHMARDCLRKALDQCEDDRVTESGVAFIEHQVRQADDHVTAILRQTETLKAAIVAASRKQQELLIV